MLSRLFTTLTLTAALIPLLGVDARQISKPEIHKRQAESAKRWTKRDSGVTVDASTTSTSATAQPTLTNTLPANITFSNPQASRTCLAISYLKFSLVDFLSEEFWVNGSSIPEVDFDVGDSWSGLLPISADLNETRKVSPNG